ncbi:MAG TPA: hypothetical protein VGC42_25420, partial [Kofleriaceae bacterium]
MGIVLSLAACGVESGQVTGTGDADPGAPVDPTTGEPTGRPPEQVTGGGVGPYFTTAMFWNTDVTTAAKASNSATVISALSAAGGWGNGNKMQI